ncbi:MAG: hypothetical protein L6R38_008367 [Xanthoria sp. 2 TBL-2021]|nr:MAG: hypothetical protein L6R38_008367 [Xanthoria sp. 2 TBL-2021]
MLDIVTGWLPDRVLSRILPQVMAIRNFEMVCARRIQRLKFNSGHGASPTIFDKLLNPHLNKGRPVPSQAHLTAEAILMSLAGTDTTANALVVGTYGVLNNEAVLKKLTKELREAVPDPEDTTSMTTVK